VRNEWQAVEVHNNDPRHPFNGVILTTHPAAALGTVVDQWTKRTATFTEASLCRYIMRHTQYFAITQKQYQTKFKTLKNDESR